MENPFEVIVNEIKMALREEADRIIKELRQESAPPGMSFADYIPLKVAAELLAVSPKTLSSWKDAIGHSLRFGKIYFLRQDLLRFMEEGVPVKKRKGVIYTRRR